MSKINKKYKLTDVHLSGNEGNDKRKNTIYALLVDEDGTICISATLEYILVAIRDRNLEVQGITISFDNPKDSLVSMDKYSCEKYKENERKIKQRIPKHSA